MQMENKVVIITGGGRGIGYGITEAFAAEGALAVITGRSITTLNTAKQAIESKYGTKVLAIPADNGKESDIKSVIEQVSAKYGRIDAIINNAQTIVSDIKLEDYSLKDFSTNFTTGVFAMFLYMKFAFPFLKESRGSVVNFSSGSGMNGQLFFASYNASKEAVRGLTRTAANEWGQYGININTVCPVVMTLGMEAWSKLYPDRYQNLLKTLPMRRFGDAKQDVGRVCVFLCSEAAKYITGETIGVDGGSVLRP